MDQMSKETDKRVRDKDGRRPDVGHKHDGGQDREETSNLTLTQMKPSA